MRFMDRFPLPASLEDIFLLLFRQAGQVRTLAIDKPQRKAVRAEFVRMLAVFSTFRDAYKSSQLKKPDPSILPLLLHQAIEQKSTSLAWLIEGAGYRYGH